MASPALFLSGILAVSTLAMPTQDPFLFDFTTCSQSDIDTWQEVSDTVRTVGMSKAVLALQTTRVFQRAVMFAVINPQPNGAGFAGMQTAMPSSAASHVTSTGSGLRLQVRGQGELQYWKVVLTGKDQVGTNRTDYEQKFKLQKISNREFETVDLDFSKFGAYRRGKPVKDAPPLDLANTGTFGFQTFGGVYDGYKQKGTGSLEIDSVKFY